MYDMYPWDSQDPATRDSVSQDRATQAVQVALDRRDNGGDEMPRAPRQ